MRRILLLGLIILLNQLSFADFITQEQATKIAQNYFSHKLSSHHTEISADQIQVKDIFTKSYGAETAAFYILNMQPDGFILVSADDIMQPVLGYGMNGHYNPNNSNPNFESWISGYSKELQYAKVNELNSCDEISKKWKALLSEEFNTLPEGSRDGGVESLLTSTWNQNYPYNMLCPEDEDGSGGHVYAGCVATAMSMIMHYHRYPEHGTGSYSYYASGYGTQSADFENTYYNWDAMMDNVSNSCEETKYAIAELQRHCGVSVDMMYGADGSGSYSYLVPDAVQEHFGYSADCSIEDKDYDYDWDEWMSMLREQLDAAYPIYYAGYSDDGGHAFACDGYDNEDNFHFNFGWSGSMNGMYALTGTGAVGGFDSGQRAVINFIPAEDSGYPILCSGDLELTTITGSIEDGSGQIYSYDQNAECSWLINVRDEFDSISNINFSFRRFDLEESVDLVTIYNGPSESDGVAGVFSGAEIPEDLSVNSDQVLVKFTSDGTDSGNKGFLIEYKAERPTYCNGMKYCTDESGIISDGSGVKHYNSSSICQFRIEPENATSITINFTELDMADSGDRIQIFQLDPTELLAEYTSGDSPSQLTSSTGKMHIIFNSNSEGNAQGFNLEYTSVYDEVAKNDILNNFRVYPNPTNNLLTISFNNEDLGTTDLEIIDLSGRTVFNKSLKSSNNKYYEQLSVSQFQKGLYILSIKTNSGLVQRKIVIQ